MIKGRVHSFDSFGTVDGPGIRFTVFMQGCPLRCKFCHNRDTWDTTLGKEYTPEEVINEAMKYKNYLIPSGGGITITGGEPLLQADFVREVFKLAKEVGLHTTLDTSGVIGTNIADKVLEYTDLVLLDIKEINNEKCRELTGMGSMKPIWFAKHLDKKGIPVWIRHVVIPGVNDDKEDLKQLGKFLNTIGNVEQLDLLPYHTLGVFKWEKLGVPYELEGIRQATDEDIKRAQSIIDSVRY